MSTAYKGKQFKATLPSVKQYKYGSKYSPTDKDYIREKNKKYYEEIKANPMKAKATHISYYKKKYGEQFVLNIINSLGLDDGLNHLKQLKNEFKNKNDDTTFLKSITLPYLEVY